MCSGPPVVYGSLQIQCPCAGFTVQCPKAGFMVLCFSKYELCFVGERESHVMVVTVGCCKLAMMVWLFCVLGSFPAMVCSLF